jgi:hypothetical protein
MEKDSAAEEGGISYQNMWQSLKRGQSHLHAPILITYYNNKYNFIMQKKKKNSIHLCYMDIYDVGTVQHFSMWLTCTTIHNCNMKMKK